MRKAAAAYYSALGKQRPHEARKSIPWPGLVSIFLALGCGIAALVIGLVSDGEPLDAWTIAGGYEVQPSVLLAIVATVANAFLAYAFAEGVTLSWWAKAQRGATLRSLQAAYLQSSSISGLLKSLPYFSRMAVASIAMLIVLMDAPLLQRSSTIRTYTQTTNANLTLPISTFPLPWGATGIITDHHDPLGPQLFHPMFAQVVQQYNARSDVIVPKSGCVGRCTTEIIAPGWDISCSNGTFPYRLMDFSEWNAESIAMEKNKTYKGPARTQTMFETNVTMYWDYWNTSTGSDSDTYSNAGSYQLFLYNVYKQTPGGNGTMAWRNCTLKEALMRYPITLVNDTVTLNAMPLGENRTTQQIYRAYESEGQQNKPSSMGGFWLALMQQYTAQANITLVAAWTRIDTSSAVANTYISPNTPVADLQSYNVTWTDPMDDMLSTIHELSLRSAIAFTNQIPYPEEYGAYNVSAALTDTMPYISYPNLTMVNRTLDQKVGASIGSPRTVYHTRDGWLAGGFAVICIACLAILPTYWGFWRLYGKVSLSPLEIAKAFHAPLLKERDFEGMKVRYGHAGMEKIGDAGLERLAKPGMEMNVTDATGLPSYMEDGSGRIYGFRSVGEHSVYQ